MTSLVPVLLWGAGSLVLLGAFLLLAPPLRRRRAATRVGGLLVLAGIVAAGAGLVAARRAQADAAPAPTARPTPVRTVQARAGRLVESRSYLGRVLAWEHADLATPLSGTVQEITVREGDEVSPGQVLVRIDAAEVAAAVAAVQAQLREAEARRNAQAAVADAAARTAEFWAKEAERDLALVQAGAIPQSAADATLERRAEAEGRLEAAKETLRALEASIETLQQRRQELEARLRYTRLTAPFRGLVSRRVADPGDLAAPGQVLLSVENRSRVRIAFDIPQEEQDLVAPGTPVRLPDQDLELQVDRLYPSLNPDRTKTAEVYAAPASVPPPGSFVNVEVDLQAHEGILVPEGALLQAPDGSWVVFTVQDDRAQARPVQLLGVREGTAAVAGVAAGEALIVSTYLGWNRLHDGETVEVLP